MRMPRPIILADSRIERYTWTKVPRIIRLYFSNPSRFWVLSGAGFADNLAQCLGIIAVEARPSGPLHNSRQQSSSAFPSTIKAVVASAINDIHEWLQARSPHPATS
eukprot:scaffold161908_cov33-Prasinocladus_malaysianus.AAC.1